MPIKTGFTLAEWIARLTRGYKKATGKDPDGLAKLKIKMEAGQKVKDQSKVIKGDFNPNEKWWEAGKKDRKLTKDELDDLYEEFDEAVPYPMETVGDKEKFLKAVKDEEAYMFQQYKKGNLDPKPGEPGRKQFLEKKLEEMELSGDKRLMTREEIEELSSFDLGTEMEEAVKKYKQKDIKQKRALEEFDVTGKTKHASGGRIGFHEGSLRHQKEHDYQSLEEEGNVMKHLMLSGDRAKMSSPENWVDRLLGKKDWKYNQKRDDFETMMKERFMYGKRKTPNVFQGTWKEFQDMYENFIKSKMATGAGGIAGQLHLNEGGRAGFPFGGPVKGKKALKAIMDAFRSNKHWGVGGPPYDPVATSFDVKKITERIYGAPLSLADIRKGAKHPQMSGINKFDFPAFNKKWKEVKANVLKEKLEESQRWATSQIKAAKEVPAEDATGKKVKAQFLREGEKKLKEANEGLKEIEIYINMLQKKGRKLHAAGGIARAGYFLGDLVKEKIPAEYRLYAKSILPGGESGKVGSDYFTEDFKQELRKQALDKYNMTGKVRGTVGESFQHRGDPTVNELIGFPSTYASLGTYTYDVDPKTLDVKITDRYDWNPAYGKQKIADTESVGWIGDKKGKDVDLTMLKDYVVNAVKNKEIDKASALELIGNYFGGKASEGKGFDVDIDIPTREATLATEGSFASGGIARVGFDKGGMSRRGFLKTMAGLASIPLIGKYFKWAKPASKIAATVEKTGAGTGMPVWFPKFVDKVLKEGTDATGAYATAERQIVKKINLPESNTEVLVTHDLVSGDTMVDVGLSKHGFGAGRHGQPAQLYLSKGEEISPDIIAPGMRDAKGLKTKDEFWVDEAEFTGGHPENVKFEDSIQFNYGEHGSDFSELEKFATGKNVDKKIIGKQADKDAWAQGHAESRAEQMAEEGLDEFAQGGRARFQGGGGMYSGWWNPDKSLVSTGESPTFPGKPGEWMYPHEAAAMGIFPTMDYEGNKIAPASTPVAEDKSLLEKWGEHAQTSQAMKGVTGQGVIPEYGMQTGYDFQKKFAGTDPRLSSYLAALWQLPQEMGRAGMKYLKNPAEAWKSNALSEGWKTANVQAGQNIEGIMAAAPGVSGLTAEQQANRNKYLSSLGQKVENLQSRGIDERMAGTYEQNRQLLADPRMRGAKGGLAKILGV